ncbi:MAG: P-II family nitrogen regulator [Candidatus Anammoxibacter sp.]
MKLVKAILKSERAVVLKDELQNLGYHGITTRVISGYIENRAMVKQVYRGRVFEQRVDAVKRVELELVVVDNKVDDVIGTIKEVGKTGQGGDGRIYILTLDDAIHIDSGTKHMGDSSEEGDGDV